MNTELLQQLIDMANTAGEGAYWLLVIYLLESYFFAALWAVTFWFIAYHVIRIFRGAGGATSLHLET